MLENKPKYPFSAFFWFFPAFLLQHRKLCHDRVFSVAIEFLCYNRKLCRDRVFFVAIVFFVQLVMAITSSF